MKAVEEEAVGLTCMLRIRTKVVSYTFYLALVRLACTDTNKEPKDTAIVGLRGETRLDSVLHIPEAGETACKRVCC